jgi:hypothetical protein
MACDDGDPCTADSCEALPCPLSAAGNLAQFGASCYTAFSTYSTNWGEAEEMCLAWGGHLAAIGSPDENGFVAALAEDASFGANYFTLLGGFNYGSGGGFQWTAGDPWSYQNWSPIHLPSIPTLPPGYAVGMVIEPTFETYGMWSPSKDAQYAPFDFVTVVCERPLQGHCRHDMICGVPKPSCAAVHGPGGCDDPSCEACVCLTAPSCCQSGWESSCVALATTGDCSEECAD